MSLILWATALSFWIATPGPVAGRSSPTLVPPLGAIGLSLSAPDAPFLQGTPALVVVQLTNRGTARTALTPYWMYQAGWDGVFGPGPPITVARLDDHQETSLPISWRRVEATRYPGVAGVAQWSVLLEPDESVEIVWNLRWQHDLPPGRYRVRFEAPSGPHPGEGPLLTAGPLDLEVHAPTGTATEVWQATAALRAALDDIEADRDSWLYPAVYRNRYPALPPIDPLRVTAGTAYEVACCYKKISATLFNSPTMFPALLDDAFVRDVQRLCALLEGVPGPIAERARLTRDTLVLPYTEFSEPAWGDRVGVAVDRLRSAEDHEWARAIAQALAWLASLRDRLLVQRRQAQGHVEERRPALPEAYVRVWGWPWHTLPSSWPEWVPAQPWDWHESVNGPL